MDCSPPDSSVHGIFQARVLEWVPPPGDLPNPGIEPMSPVSLVLSLIYLLDFPDGSDGKVSARNAGDLGSIPGSGRSRGEGNGTPLQYPCLENFMN